MFMDLLHLTEGQKDRIKNGVIAEAGVTEFALLLAIQSFASPNGVAVVSQKVLADLTGINSITTVRKALDQLEEKGLVKKVTTQDGKMKSTSYHLIPQTEEEGEPRYKTAKDFIQHFRQLYADVYGVDYVPNWAKDSVQVKTKLLNTYSDDQLEGILLITFRDYPHRWANKQFPRPTIGAITTFISNHAVTTWEKEHEKKTQIEQTSETDLDKYFDQQDF